MSVPSPGDEFEERRDALLDIVRAVNATLEPPKIADLIVERRTDDPFAGYEGMMARIAKIPHVVACAPARAADRFVASQVAWSMKWPSSSASNIGNC